MRKWNRVIPVVVGVIGLFDLYLALIWSPPEQHMGNIVRIMYFHVSCAWIAFLSFFVTFLYSVLYLIVRRLSFDRIALAAAEIGVVFTSLTLVSGSIWGRAVWNTWWTWDPRLTTTLILWFLYIGYLLLRGSIDGFERRARISAVFAIIAFIDVPIIHMSVTWWRSIHPSVIDNTGFHMPAAMVTALMFGFVTFLCIFLFLLSVRVRQEAQKMRIFAIRQKVREIRANSGGIVHVE